MQVRP